MNSHSNLKYLGFTLIELLIGISLLGIMMVVLYGGLNLAIKSWDAAQVHSQKMDERRYAGQFIRRQLEQARPAVWIDDQLKVPVVFKGTSTYMQFVAPILPRSGAVGGLYMHDLKLRSDFEEKWLELGYSLLALANNEEDLSEHTGSVRLMKQIIEGEFSYFGESVLNDGQSAWQPYWDNPNKLPTLVRLRLKGSSNSVGWPDLVIALRTDNT